MASTISVYTYFKFKWFILSSFFFSVELFELMLNVKVKSYGHVGMLPPFYGTFTQKEDVMASSKCFEYSHPTKTERLIYMDGLT